MIETWVQKKGSVLPVMMLKVGENGNGFTSDPTGSTVTFTMRLRNDHSGTAKIANQAGSIQNIVQKSDGTWYGELVYAWVAGDVDTKLKYDGEFKVVISGKPLLIPIGKMNDANEIEDKYIPIEFYEGLQ